MTSAACHIRISTTAAAFTGVCGGSVPTLTGPAGGAGGGAGEPAKRRSRAAGLEYKWERERRAAAIAAKQGWRVHRTGDFMVYYLQ